MVMPRMMASNSTPLDQFRRARQLAALNNISTLLAMTLDGDYVQEAVAASILELTDADGAAVLLYPDDGLSDLEFVHSEGAIPELTHGLPPMFLLSEQQFTDIAPFSPIDIENDPRATPIRDGMLRSGFRCMIELPLLVGTAFLGEVVVYFRRVPAFSDEDIEYLRILTNQASLSLNHARIHARTDKALERKIGQISGLAAITQELTAVLDLPRLFRLILDRAIEGTGSKSGVLLLRPERPSDPMQVVAQRGIDKRRTAQIMQQPSVYQALTTIKSNIAGDEKPEMSVPISREGDLIGVIALQSETRRGYGANEIEFVQQLANQALIAIDNAQLFRRIEENRDRLQVILDSMHEAVLLLDNTGTVLLANPQITHLLGLSTPYILGKGVGNLLNEANQPYAQALGFTRENLQALLKAVAAGESPDILPHIYQTESPAKRYIERTVVLTHDPGKRVSGVLMVFSDVTSERNEQQAREDLSRMIVHDLRSPLTAISATLRILADLKLQDAKTQDLIGKMTDASQRALRKVLNLVESLLDIARMESGQISLDLSTQSIGAITENVRIELAPLAEELEIRLEAEIPPGTPPVNVDASKIERVLLNLMDNALKFAPVDGLVQVRAFPLPGDPSLIRVEVRDNGPGIPDDYKTRIFDRFQQVEGSKGRRRGTGLGLTFCKLTVEAHGGRIWIEDNPGGGSVFAFTLPVAAAAAADD